MPGNAYAAILPGKQVQIFEHLVGDEEGHEDQFEKQLDNIKRFGPSYLALQSFGVTAGPAGTT